MEGGRGGETAWTYVGEKIKLPNNYQKTNNNNNNNNKKKKNTIKHLILCALPCDLPWLSIMSHRFWANRFTLAFVPFFPFFPVVPFRLFCFFCFNLPIRGPPCSLASGGLIDAFAPAHATPIPDPAECSSSGFGGGNGIGNGSVGARSMA